MLFGKPKVVDAVSRPGVKFNRFSKMTIGSRLALLFIALLVVVAVAAPVISPEDPLAITVSYQSPTAEHLFGTDNVGRDVMTRVFYGARYSLVIGLLSILFALVLGALIGAIAAVARTWISEIIMRVIDVFMSVPGIALAAVFVSILGQSMFGIIAASASCTCRRSPASCARTSSASTARTTCARSSSPAPAPRGFSTSM